MTERIRLSQRAVCQPVDGQLVLVMLPDLEAIVLDSTARDIVEGLPGRTPRELADLLVERYQIDLETAYRDVQALVSELLALGALVIEDTSRAQEMPPNGQAS